jgi:hypothetical protein
MRKTMSVIAGVLLALGSAAVAAPASAEPPGPGSKQCVPGQHGSPQPGFKAGACDNGK